MIDEALALYGLEDWSAKLIRHNENMTYCLERASRRRLLRIHRPVRGFDTSFLRAGADAAEFVAGEIDVLETLGSHADLGTQRVVRNRMGENVSRLPDGTPVTVLEWIDGDTLSGQSITADTARALGEMTAALHGALENCRPSGRYRYDAALLERMAGECERAAMLGHFQPNIAGRLCKRSIPCAMISSGFTRRSCSVTAI